MDLDTISAGLKVGGGLKSLFGKKPSAQEQSRDALMGQAQGAREAAEKYGFNPLTLLGVSSGIGANAAGDTPLASIEMITGAMEDIADVYTSDEAHDQARERFGREMTGIEFDRARSGLTTTLTRPVLASTAMPGGDTFGGDHAIRTDAAGNPITSLVMGGKVVRPNEKWSDTEMIETRYGDVGGAFYGAGVALADYAANNGHTPVDQVTAPSFGDSLATSLGAVPIEDMPLSERPARWMVREWGSVPDGWEAGGEVPYWHPDGDETDYSYRAPNGKAVW